MIETKRGTKERKPYTERESARERFEKNTERETEREGRETRAAKKVRAR